jgi:hypothetical protein
MAEQFFMKTTILRTCVGGLCLLGLVVATCGTAQAVLLAYDPFLTLDDPTLPANRAAGEYTPEQFPSDPNGDIRTQGAAALGWEGTQGIDGFGLAYAGSTANFRVNLLGENSAAVNYESPNGRLQWQGAGSVFDRNITRQLNETVRSTESSEWWFTIMVNRLGWVGDPAFNTFAVGGFTDATGNGRGGWHSRPDSAQQRHQYRVAGRCSQQRQSICDCAARYRPGRQRHHRGVGRSR